MQAFISTGVRASVLCMPHASALPHGFGTLATQHPLLSAPLCATHVLSANSIVVRTPLQPLPTAQQFWHGYYQPWLRALFARWSLFLFGGYTFTLLYKDGGIVSQPPLVDSILLGGAKWFNEDQQALSAIVPATVNAAQGCEHGQGLKFI